jgi:membrane protein DedA with SNARE-associated domain
VVSLFAGFFALRWYWVLALSFVSAFIWNGLLIYAGYLVGVNWEKIATLIKQYNQWVLILMALALTGYVAYRFLTKRKKVQ